MITAVAPTARTLPQADLRLRAERLARNVPLSSSAEYNPALERDGLLGRFLETWEHIFVLCYRESCLVHTPAGAPDGRRMWWPSVQRRVTVFDGAELDARHGDVIAWAGCDLPNRSAGRSFESENRGDPCVFVRRAGGADWRRTAKHRLTTLLAHLTLVELAASRNLTSVLILEADAVPSLAVAELSRSARQTARVAARLGRAFETRPWAVARLSGMFYSQAFAPAPREARRGPRVCSRECTCRRWGGSDLLAPLAAYPRLCEVSPSPSPADRIEPMVAGLDSWCDVRDTAAYVVHRSAFPTFVAYLRRLRARRAPRLDPTPCTSRARAVLAVSARCDPARATR